MKTILYNRSMSSAEALRYIHNGLLQVEPEDMEDLLTELLDRAYDNGYDAGVNYTGEL